MAKSIPYELAKRVFAIKGPAQAYISAGIDKTYCLFCPVHESISYTAITDINDAAIIKMTV